MFQVLNDMLSIMGWKFEADVEIDDSNSNVLEDDKSYQSMVLSHKNCIYCKSVVFELELKINFQTSEYTSFIQLSLTTHLDHEKKISFRSCDFFSSKSSIHQKQTTDFRVSPTKYNFVHSRISLQRLVTWKFKDLIICHR